MYLYRYLALHKRLYFLCILEDLRRPVFDFLCHHIHQLKNQLKMAFLCMNISFVHLLNILFHQVVVTKFEMALFFLHLHIH